MWPPGRRADDYRLYEYDADGEAASSSDASQCGKGRGPSGDSTAPPSDGPTAAESDAPDAVVGFPPVPEHGPAEDPGSPPHRGASLRLRLVERLRRQPFLPVKLAQASCAVYVLVLTFSYAPVGLRDRETGDVVDAAGGSRDADDDGYLSVNGDLRPVAARGAYELFCLGMSRTAAFALYPPMALAYLSKCRAALGYLENTPVSMFLIKDEHGLHVYCGRFIAFVSWIHAMFHTWRWANQGNLGLLWRSRAGLSGSIALLITPLITFVMMYFKNTLPYEIRKGLHYLLFPFAITLCFHVPPSGIPNGGFIAYVLGFVLTIYSLDKLYVILAMTERAEPRFRVLPSGVQMTVTTSDRFRRRAGGKGGYCYVCVPWVSDRQWHAFSLFQDPSDPASRQVFMLDVGDWTEAVREELRVGDTSRPVWIQGPFSSPYKMARDFDNQILVGTGVGITPALAVIEAHRENRTIFLIWSTRDWSMVEFLLKHYHYLDHKRGFNYIHYTGRTPLDPNLLEGLAPNIKILHSRPNFDAIVPGIIHSSESSDSKHGDTFGECSRCRIIQRLLEKSKELDIDVDGMSPLSDRGKIASLTQMVKDDGCELSDLSDHFRDAAIACPFAPPREPEGSRPSVASDPPTQEPDTPGKIDHVVFKRIRKYADIWSSTLHASRTVKNMRRKPRQLSRWGIMYCGGSSTVKSALRRTSEDYGIDLHCESFAW